MNYLEQERVWELRFAAGDNHTTERGLDRSWGIGRGVPGSSASSCKNRTSSILRAKALVDQHRGRGKPEPVVRHPHPQVQTVQGIHEPA